MSNEVRDYVYRQNTVAILIFVGWKGTSLFILKFSLNFILPPWVHPLLFHIVENINVFF